MSWDMPWPVWQLGGRCAGSGLHTAGRDRPSVARSASTPPLLYASSSSCTCASIIAFARFCWNSCGGMCVWVCVGVAFRKPDWKGDYNTPPARARVLSVAHLTHLLLSLQMCTALLLELCFCLLAHASLLVKHALHPQLLL